MALPLFCTWLPHNWTLLLSVLYVQHCLSNIFMTAVLICLTD